MTRSIFDKRYDVAIVGAGIVGCSTAYFLAQKGLNVIVCDRGAVGAEQSSRAWGFIRKQGRDPAELPLAEAAIEIWDNITERYGAQSTHRAKAGILMPAETDADEKIIQESYQSAQQLGIKSEILTSGQLSEMLPKLRGGWRCALFTPSDGHADPAASVQTFHKAALENGVDFATELTVIGLPAQGANVSGVLTSRGMIHADHVVIASGIGSRKLLGQLGYNAPIQTIRSSAVETAPAEQFTDIAMWCPKVSFRPNRDGSFVVGNGYRNVRTNHDLTLESLTNLRYFLPAILQNRDQLKITLGAEMLRSLTNKVSRGKAFDPLQEPQVDRQKTELNLAEFNRLFPEIGPLEKARQWAGRIDITPDLLPIIDKLNAHENAYVACGFSGYGFAVGPAVGQQLSEWIATGSSRLDLTKFRHARFSEGAFEVAKAV